jgi:hypothetical protein
MTVTRKANRAILQEYVFTGEHKYFAFDPPFRQFVPPNGTSHLLPNAVMAVDELWRWIPPTALKITPEGRSTLHSEWLRAIVRFLNPNVADLGG